MHAWGLHMHAVSVVRGHAGVLGGVRSLCKKGQTLHTKLWVVTLVSRLLLS